MLVGRVCDPFSCRHNYLRLMYVERGTLDFAAGNHILAEETISGTTLHLYGKDCLGELRGGRAPTAGLQLRIPFQCCEVQRDDMLAFHLDHALFDEGAQCAADHLAYRAELRGNLLLRPAHRRRGGRAGLQ